MCRVFISLGSNVGNRAGYLKVALSMLQRIPQTQLIQSSPLYETEPVGFKDQDWFLNLVAEIETELSPHKLLKALQIIEEKLKRERAIPLGPRTIDLDILLYDKKIIDDPNLIVPHPRMHERAFVLVPFCDIAAEICHPLLNCTIRELLGHMEMSEKLRPYKEDSADHFKKAETSAGAKKTRR